MIWTLLTQSYWRDEAFRIFMARLPFLKIIQLAPYDGQPPFYYFLLHFWMKIFGDSEIATRSLSLLCFELIIFLGFKFGLKLLPKTKFPLFTAALLALNPLLIYYAFETRMYIFLILFATLSYYFLWTKKWTWWVIASVLGLYTHNFMIFVLASQFVYLALNRELSKKVWGYFFLLGLLYLPWVPVVVQQTRLVESDFWVGPLSLKLLFLSLSGLLTGYEGDPLSLVPLFGVLTLILAVVILLGRRVNKKVWWFLLSWLVLPGLFTFIISSLGRSLFITRYLSFLVFPLVFLIALAIYQKNNWFKGIGLTVAVALFLYLTQLLYPSWLKTDIRIVAGDVAAAAKPGDLILTDSLNYFESKYYIEKNIPLFAKLSSNDYTMNNSIKIYTPDGPLPFFVGKVLIPDENTTTQIPQDRRVFLIEKTGRLTISLPVLR